MAQLAIKGHATRGEEVIEILEMLGGVNKTGYDGSKTFLYYFINDNRIDWCYECTPESNFISFTLEEFLEKFPYKIRDRVRVAEYESEVRINDMKWDGNAVQYEVFTDVTEYYSAKELNLFNEPLNKEETIENKPDLLQQLKDYFDNTPREVVEKELHEYDKYNEIGPTVDEYLEYVNKIRQPKYPKTFIECYEILYPNENFQTVSQPIKGHNGKKLFILQKLLICRDAYWKIAGEQMELGGPWKYDMSKDEFSYAISYQYGRIQKNEIRHKNAIFAFPTAEIRDAFKENFDDDIEFCKEFL